MRTALVLACLTLVIVGTMAASSRARSDDGAMAPPDRLVESYLPPQGDRAGDPVRGRAGTYDSAGTPAAFSAAGELDGSGAGPYAPSGPPRGEGALGAPHHPPRGDGAG